MIVTPLLTAVLGFLAGNWSRFRLANRLRASITTDLTILKELPDGQARQLLTRQVEYRAHLIATEEEPFTTGERNDRRWGATYVALGVLLPMMLPSAFNFPDDSTAAQVATWVMVAVGATSAFYGLNLITRTSRAREWRRLHSRISADHARQSRPGDGVGYGDNPR
jgi:hypothetical protein